MRLIDGMGQLGEELKKRKCRKHVLVYHTWNFLDKSLKVQRAEYNKFKRFVNDNKNKRIVLISTNCSDDNYYTEYKRKASDYLFSNCKKPTVVFLPNIIGKGICQKFRDEDVEPLGYISFITLESAVNEIMMAIENDCNSYVVERDWIPAKIAKELIKFGANK